MTPMTTSYSPSARHRSTVIQMKPEREAMSTAQKETFLAIKEFIADNGYCPTIKELSDGAGIRVNAMLDRLKALQKKGWIARKPGGVRSIKPIDLEELEAFNSESGLLEQEPLQGGQQCVVLSSGMSDAQILALIKNVCRLSNGQAFQVTATPDFF